MEVPIRPRLCSPSEFLHQVLVAQLPSARSGLDTSFAFRARGCCPETEAAPNEPVRSRPGGLRHTNHLPTWFPVGADSLFHSESGLLTVFGIRVDYLLAAYLTFVPVFTD